MTLAEIISLSIALLMFFDVFPITQAETITTFTSADKFDIAELHSSISFAVNGSYSEATLKNGTWIFRDLALNNQSIADFGLNALHSVGDLSFSTQDSNVTILAYLTLNYSFPVSILSYTVEGEGKQIVNLGLNSSSPPDAAEWSVIIADNVFLAEGQGWTFLPDNTVIINSANSNVTVMHFDYLNSIDGNLVFYIQHSVALTTAVVLTMVVTLGIIIKVRRRNERLPEVNSFVFVGPLSAL
jgi:hypothetical protein